MTDEQLTDLWEAGVAFPGGVSHERHLRIAWILHSRHGSDEARARLLAGTKLACERHGRPEKFDAVLTARWSDAIATAIREDGAGSSGDAFLRDHPHLTEPDLFGRPEARRNTRSR